MRVGIDYVSSDRFTKSLSNKNFLEKNFTKNEIEYINSKPKKNETLAGLFAAKESFLKALQVGVFKGIELIDIEVTHNQKGAPELKITQEIKQKYNINEISISISHDQGAASAVCVLN